MKLCIFYQSECPGLSVLRLLIRFCEPRDYFINSDKDFDLYINLSVPEFSNANGRYSANVFLLNEEDEQLVVFIDGFLQNWEEFYEPFGRDYYLKGPEFRQAVGTGRYLIRVFDSNYRDKYSLAIGEQESFSLNEIWNTLKILPALKRDFFNKSSWTMFFNYIGLYLLGALLVLAAAVFLVWRMIKRFRK